MRIINQRGQGMFVSRTKKEIKFICRFVLKIKLTLLIAFVKMAVKILGVHLLFRLMEYAGLNQMIIVLIFVRKVTFANLFSLLII